MASLKTEPTAPPRRRRRGRESHAKEVTEASGAPVIDDGAPKTKRPRIEPKVLSAAESSGSRPNISVEASGLPPPTSALLTSPLSRIRTPVAARGPRHTSVVELIPSVTARERCLLHCTDIWNSIVQYLTWEEQVIVPTVCREWRAKCGLVRHLLVEARSGLERYSTFWNAQESERQYTITEYFLHQPQVTPRMRQTLLDWLVDVNTEFRQSEFTMHLAAKLIDRLLVTVPVLRRELQLVGAVCCLIASKMEEYSCPTINELAFLCAQIYTPRQFVRMEQVILKKLGFRLHCPTIMTFLQFYFHEYQFDTEMREVGLFLSELLMLEARAVVIAPSLLATTIACMTLFEFNVTYHQLLTYSKWDRAHLVPVVALLEELLTTPNRTPEMERVFVRFGTEKHSKVATRDRRVGFLSHVSRGLAVTISSLLPGFMSAPQPLV